MFVGRDAELDRLERCARKGTFQMAVIYGRRRVGKTALIAEFARGRR
ncbi:MAG: AAA family ATPase [Eggerthellaceae bacterium]|nr:AAA family ATPase [Eggerthellaceae bacterium]